MISLHRFMRELSYWALCAHRDVQGADSQGLYYEVGYPGGGLHYYHFATEEFAQLLNQPNLQALIM